MAAAYDFDVLILGAGPGGYVAAIRAAQLGLKAAVIERDKPGGVCVNIGCIPSKALIHQAELVRSIPRLQELGVSVDAKGLDYGKVLAKSRKAADTNSKGVAYLFKKNKVELIAGEGRITGRGEMTVAGRKVTAKNLLIATGGRPRIIPGFEHDEKQVLSSTGAILLERLPKSMTILGGGVIGIEFAHILNAFGVEVHVVELMEQILPLEDAETVKVVASSLSRRGIRIRAATKALSMQKGSDSVTLTVEGKGGQEKIEAEKLMVVVGRTPNTDAIGLESIGLKPEKNGTLAVRDFYQTAVPGVYAIGDVVAEPWLAHVASKQGEIAVEHMAGHPPRLPRVDATLVPSVIFCEPQVASFGLSEQEAVKRGLKVKKGVFPYRGVGKSVAVERTEGHVKVLTEAGSDEILGVSIVGAEATELVHELMLARSSELLPEDVHAMIHAHPTFSEALKEAVLSVEGKALHV